MLHAALNCTESLQQSKYLRMSKTNVIDKRNSFTSLNVSTKAWSVYVDLDLTSSHAFFDESSLFRSRS